MKILYGIQGTGNGHLSRAIAIIPELRKHGEVDILISGIQSDIDLPFEVKFKLHGLSFIFGKQGGIDFLATYRKNYIRRFIQEIRQLDVATYDLVITDFEPITAWACFTKGKPCFGLSNQYAVLAENAPRPKNPFAFGRFILNCYAPVTWKFGFHFQRYNEQVQTPIIRPEIRQLEVSDAGHYTVYLPAYEDHRIVEFLKNYPHISWQVFSKHNESAFEDDNVMVQPIRHQAFLRSMASASGVLCAAGFATASEAMYLGKKLLVVPQKSQYEQECNAKALGEMGVPVIKSLSQRYMEIMEHWLLAGEPAEVHYPDNTNEIVSRIIQLGRSIYPAEPQFVSLEQAILN